MAQTDDHLLLREYAVRGSEEAFRTLVERYADLVYSAAFRRVQDRHLAEDVAQNVFCKLAQKAGAVRRERVVAGWLFRAVRFESLKYQRTAARSQAREQAAALIETARVPEPNLEMLTPLLDAALDQLREKDRQALLLRFFQNKSLQEIAAALETTEDGAQKRVARALDRLRSSLGKGNAKFSASAVVGALSAAASQAAPASLAPSVLTCAALSSATVGGSILNIGVFMTWTKLKTGLAIGAVAAGALTPMVIQHQKMNQLEQENATLQSSLAESGQVHAALEDRLARLQDELGVFQQQAAEVHGLRNTVTLLRGNQEDLAKLKAEADALRALLAAAQREEFVAQTPDVEEERKDAEKEWGIRQMNGVKNLALGMIMFANQNEGQFPPSLKQAEDFIPGDVGFAGMIDLEAYEILTDWYGRYDEIQDLTRAIIVRQKLPWPTWNGRWAKTYAFADGHAEIRSESTPEAFEAWERERLP